MWYCQFDIRFSCQRKIQFDDLQSRTLPTGEQSIHSDCYTFKEIYTMRKMRKNLMG